MAMPLRLVAALLLAPLALFPAQKKGVPMAHLPPQTVAIADLPLATPVQACANWSWAAAVETMLKTQHVSELTQTLWIRKTYPGDVCDDRTIAPDRLQHA